LHAGPLQIGISGVPIYPLLLAIATREYSAIGALVAREATDLRSLAMTTAASGSQELMG